MDAKTLNAVADTLETAILQVSQSEFGRITRGLPPDSKVSRAVSARQSLSMLRSDLLPNYSDEFVALAYLGQYQLGHINLAFSTFKYVESRRSPSHLLLGGTDKLHVIDFGAGALAGQFSVALSVASFLDQGGKVSEVKVDSIDTSAAILNIGQKAWGIFAADVCKRHQGTSLAKACEMIDAGFETHTRYQEVGILSNADTWLTAFHSVYQQEPVKTAIKNALLYLYQRHNPVVGVMTCQYKADSPTRGNLRAALDISPFPSDSPPVTGIGPYLPDARRSPAIASRFRDWGLFPGNYYRVFWGWKRQEVAFLIYAPNNHIAVEDPNPKPAQRSVLAERGQRQRRRESAGVSRDTLVKPSGTSSAGRTPPTVSVDARVRVGQWGTGTVIRIRNDRATVVLDSGKRIEVAISGLKPQ